MARNTIPTGRAHATREQILVAAERLFAEHGVFSVSNRQVSEAAGQGNNFAVGYHFGTKTDLVRAIVHRHQERIDAIRERMVTEVPGEGEVRDWVACLVRPITEHLAEIGPPSWYGRFGAQVMTDPVLRAIMIEDALSQPLIQRVLDGLGRCLPELPGEVARERSDMTRLLMVHVVAERERALADGRATRRSTWEDAANGLADAIVGLWLAPVTGR
ncbi:MAG TPA: TetR family transcriptional regulator [Actinocatenispora sp.]